MKTPYDAALRLRRREIDEMRVAIGVEVGHVLALDQLRAQIDHATRAERQLATDFHGFSSDAYVARMRAQHAAISTERSARDARLIELRAQAVEAFGSLSAISAAADDHRDTARRAANVAEQAQIDDFSAAGFARVAGSARRARSLQASEA